MPLLNWLLKDKKIIAVLIVIPIILIVLSILYMNISCSHPNEIEKINEKFNSLRKLDTSCNVDEDCKMASIDCGACGGKIAAVNMNYNNLCPFPNPCRLCTAVYDPWWEEETFCIENKCVSNRKYLYS